MEDMISRKAAIDALAKFVPYAICDESTESYTNGLTDAYNLICQLPSAQPETHEERTETHACDYISRQAAYETLTEYYHHTTEIQHKALREALERVPSAQPEIIHCKDCKWKQGSECVRFAEVRPFPDDYCSRAERRTDERTD